MKKTAIWNQDGVFYWRVVNRAGGILGQGTATTHAKAAAAADRVEDDDNVPADHSTPVGRAGDFQKDQEEDDDSDEDEEDDEDDDEDWDDEGDEDDED